MAMKYRAIQELKTKSEADLLKLLKDNKEELRAFAFNLAAGKVKNVQEVREKRKTIARILTFLAQRHAHTS